MELWMFQKKKQKQKQMTSTFVVLGSWWYENWNHFGLAAGPNFWMSPAEEPRIKGPTLKSLIKFVLIV